MTVPKLGRNLCPAVLKVAFELCFCTGFQQFGLIIFAWRLVTFCYQLQQKVGNTFVNLVSEELKPPTRKT